jgi:tripeptide aminopeptidase
MYRLLAPAALSLLLIGSTSQLLKAQQAPAIDKRYVDEIKKLADQPAVKTAFQTFIDLEPQTKQDLINLTETPSPPF